MADSSTENNRRQQGFGALTQHVSSHKLEMGLWATRILTIFFTIAYFLPIFPAWLAGGHPVAAYHKALMSNAATSALRLHQRLPRVAFTREFLATLLLEDSAHYLLYSLLFLYTGSDPVTVALLPIALFAILHSASYSLTLLDTIGSNNRNWWLGRFLISLVELQSRGILRMAAFSEIFLMPMTIILVFTGRVSILTPFMYYRFLGLRYSSRRNPYTRAVFYELRVSLEQAAAGPNFPQFARGLLYKAITMVSSMAPQTVYPPPEQ